MSGKVSFGKDSIKPDFLRTNHNTNHNTNNTPENTTAARSAIAQSNLRNLESSASSMTTTSDYSAETAEASAESDFTYTNNRSTSSSKFKKRNKSSKSRLSSLKKSAPILAIGAALFGCFFFLFGSASMLGSQIETLITRATDTMFGSYSENTVRITKELLNDERGNFPDYFKDRLKAKDIKVVKAGSGYNLNYSGNTITASNFDDYYENDINFREAFSTAKRGRTSNFFDISGAYAFTKINLSRNLFKSYRQTGKADVDNKSFRTTISDVFKGGTNTRVNTVTEQEVEDEDGNKHTERTATGEDISSSNGSGDSPKVKAKNYLTEIAGRVSDAGGIACAALKVGNLISVAVAVNNIYNAIHLFANSEENTSKTIYGDGEHAAMNYHLNDLSETKTTTYIDAETGEEKEVTGAPLEGEGFANALAGEKPNLNKTKNYSIEAAFTTTGFAIGLTAANNKLCGGVRVAGAVISLASFALSGVLVKGIVTLAKSLVVNVALQSTISAMLSVLIPQIAKSLFSNTFDDLEGIPKGETFVEGADLLNSKVGRSSSGQLLATRETAEAYNKYTIAAANREAEIDRATHSPFDPTNPNTFLGSFVGKFATITGASSFINSLTSAASVVRNSFGSLAKHFTGQAFAADLEDIPLYKDTTLSGTDFQTVYSDPKTCENLTSIGAACDMYGAEIVATDSKVININSNDPKYLEILSRNVTKTPDGHYKVIKGSTLSKKIKYCDERDSPFGTLDANIVNDFETNLGALGNVPGLSDVVEIVNAVESASDEAIGWGKGTYCVMDPNTNPYYEELIYLQHFEEDQRIGTQIKLDEVTDADGNNKSAITAYKDEYYAKNPIDTSEAGLLAHFTGYTKKDAELALALIDYVAYLEDYTPPTTLLSEEPTPEQALTFTSHLTESTHTNFLSHIIHPIEYNIIKDKYYAA